MADSERVNAVTSLLFDYAKSPSLRHIRDPYQILKLAQQIVQAIDRRTSMWEKWPEEREALLRAAAACWIPLDDLRDFFNKMAGPTLTRTDVEQRLRAIHEERWSPYPDEAFKADCEAIGSVAKIVKLEHAWRRLDGRNDDGFQVAPFPG